MKSFKESLQLVPKQPGCYQMKNAAGDIIYVGKAKVLQNRLKSYFTGSHDSKTTRMVSEVDHFEYIVTSSELEAFLLELNFIKEHRPKYNILLMDDKSYPYICLTSEEHPRLIMTRDVAKIKRKGKAKLFGPYPNAKACRDTVEILNKVFPLRKCQHIPKKECLYYSMHQCLAPCINQINPQDYDDIRNNLVRFLNGYDTEFLNMLKSKMLEASENLEFERALEYRDMITSIETLQEDQKMTFHDGINRDIFGYFIKDDIIAIQVFHMRSGKIITRTGNTFDITGSVDEMLLTYIYQFYNLPSSIKPQEILIPYIESATLLRELLGIKVTIPVKGLKKQLVDLVCENAKVNLEILQKERLIRISKTTSTLEELAKILTIDYPRVIELFDNSNIQGVSSVSAMVVYVDGVASPKDYRKYKIKTVEGADDYHTMQEVLTRRYARLLRENLKMPNLIIVDGGRPQVQAAKIILDQLQITNITIMGLAKDNKHRTRAIVKQDGTEIAIDKHSNLYLLLEAMQDEVHRFAITFFRKVHSESALASRLDEIPGIGKARKKKLLASFDSIEEIKTSSIEKLKSLGFPESVAKELLNKLK